MESDDKLIREYGGLSDESARVKHIYACFGLAVYYAQVFEVNVQNYVFMLRIRDEQPRTLGEYDALDLRLQRQVLGVLLATLRKYVSFPESEADQIRLAVEARNRLVHGFWYKHTHRMMTPEGERGVLVRIVRMMNVLQEADAILESKHEPLRRSLGLTHEREQEYLDRIYQGEYDGHLSIADPWED